MTGKKKTEWTTGKKKTEWMTRKKRTESTAWKIKKKLGAKERKKAGQYKGLKYEKE